MKTLIRTLALMLLALPAASSAQVKVDIQMNLPAILPPLVAVQPGVQVVRDYDEEIFYVDNHYWVMRDGRWYRARDHRARWVYVEQPRVPVVLVRAPPGHYRHWRPEREPERRPIKWKKQKHHRRHHDDDDDDEDDD